MSKCCAIMQPTYFPWPGYFNLMANVDFFIFLDDVQFEKQSWQNRNRVLVNDKPHWLTVPVNRLHLSNNINEIRIDNQKNWRHKHLELVRHSYARHAYANESLELMTSALNVPTEFLSKLNISLIKETANLLNIKPKTFLSSELNITGTRSERLLRLCEYFGCDSYLSPRGSAEYLSQDGDFERSNVQLKFQNFEASPYSQYKSSSFVSHLSIVDVLANIGVEATRDYVIKI